MNNIIKFICASLLSLLVFTTTSAQEYSISVGTEFPYQHYLGFNMHVNDLDISYRTGILNDPYSDILIDALSIYDYPDEVLDFLKETYEVGWMNSIGVYKRFGADKQWYLGPEFRLDYLKQQTTPVEVAEAFFDDPRLDDFEIVDENTEDVELGLLTLAFGVRVGRTFQPIKNNPRHLINAELALYRYIEVHSKVTIDGNNSEIVDELTDELLWQDFFGPHGQFPVLGVSYSYLFSRNK